MSQIRKFEQKTVLIIDDEPNSIQAITAILNHYNFNVLIATDGESGLMLAAAKQPDLILLDVILPTVDGFAICRRLKAQAITQNIPVIFLTTLNENDNIIKGFEVGGVDYIVKPILIREFLARVNTHITLYRTQQAWHESEMWLRAILENAAICIAVLDVKGNYQQVNDKCVEFFGYSRAEMLQKNCLELNHSDFVTRSQEAMRRILQGEIKHCQFDKQFVRKNGTYFWASHWLSALCTPTGECEGFVCVIIDLTARKQSEEQLRKLTRAVEQSHNTIVITDLNGNIEFANPAFTRTSGYTVQEAVGQNPKILKSGQQSTEFYQILWNTLSRGEIWQGEFCNKGKSGKLYWESATISPIKDENGNITHYLAIKEDITARKQAEQELQETNNALTQLNQEKNELLGIVAHDLKNPLQTIQGSAQLIEMALTQEDYCKREEILEFAQMINLSAERMFQLVTNLLDMNTIDSGKIQLELQSVNILPILSRIITEYREKAKTKHLLLHFVPTEPDYFAHTDAKIVHQILDNLLSNAVKYSPFYRHIYIRLNQNAQTVRCEIQDEGQGLSQAEQGKLFNKFSRLSPQPTGGEHSTGLGLFIVKKLVEAIQGKVWCESELGQGATFIVEFVKINQCG